MIAILNGGMVINGWERILEDGWVTPEHYGAVKRLW